MRIFAAVIAAALLYGCAQDRFLTAEEDAALGRACEGRSCAIMAVPFDRGAGI